VATAGGTTWIAWRQIHEDRDLSSMEVGTEARGCQQTVTADRSTYEIVLAKIGADGSADVRFHLPATAPGGFDIVRLAARGPRLLLAATMASTASGFDVRYVELDPTKL
jgi:hypothetical protein